MKKMMGLILAMIMIMSLAACGGKTDSTAQSADAAAVKIGGIGPLTGDYANYGISVKQGAELAVKEINAAGGIAVGGVIAVICGIALMCGAVALIVLCCVVQFKMYAGLAAAFRLDKGWAWGLLFVPFVFFPILGFGKQFVYYGRQPEPVQEQPEVQ